MNRSALNVLIAFCASAAILSQMQNWSLAFSILKPLTTILIILLVLLHRHARAFKTPLLVVALIACLGGDVLLLHEPLFAHGLFSFLIAHLIFAYLFYSMAKRPFNLTPLIALAIFACGFYLLLLPNLEGLAIPVAVYQLCICVMCWLAINLYLGKKNGTTMNLAIASLLFVFSDSMIAINKFLMPFEASSVVILSSYWLSIALIANALIKEHAPETLAH